MCAGVQVSGLVLTRADNIGEADFHTAEMKVDRGQIAGFDAVGNLGM